MTFLTYRSLVSRLLITFCVYTTTLPGLLVATATIEDAANSNTTQTNSTTKVCYETGCYESRQYEEPSLFGTQMVTPDSIDQLDIKFYFFYKIGIKGTNEQVNFMLSKCKLTPYERILIKNFFFLFCISI